MSKTLADALLESFSGDVSEQEVYIELPQGHYTCQVQVHNEPIEHGGGVFSPTTGWGTDNSVVGVNSQFGELISATNDQTGAPAGPEEMAALENELLQMSF